MAGLRGDDRQIRSTSSCTSAEARIPASHPARPMRALVDQNARGMSR
jgi:hypothetical protein